MANDITVTVGARSDVANGMNQVVSDVQRGADKAKVALDKSMSGKGFKGIASAFATGDISGAFEQLREKMESQSKTLTAKAMLWGGGIATALFAGIQAGMAIDQKLGISDKISKWWTKDIDKANEELRVKTEAMREQRRAKEKAAEEARKKEISDKEDAITKRQQDNDDAEYERSKTEKENQLNKSIQIKENQAILDKTSKKSSFVGRLLGRGDMEGMEGAEYDARRAFDKDFERQERATDKAMSRSKRRFDNMMSQAMKLRNAGRLDSNPRLKKFLESQDALVAAQNAKENIEQRQKLAIEAQIETQKTSLETAKNTREISLMQRELMTLKKGA